jgi:hypothetical protein
LRDNFKLEVLSRYVQDYKVHICHPDDVSISRYIDMEVEIYTISITICNDEDTTAVFRSSVDSFQVQKRGSQHMCVSDIIIYVRENVEERTQTHPRSMPI